MRRGGEHRLHIVLLAQRLRAHALAAALLHRIFIRRDALDVPAVREGEDTRLLLDEIFDVDLVLNILNLSLARVAVLVA